MCEFEDNSGKCHALGCYTNEECKGRKPDKTPDYCNLDTCEDGRHSNRPKYKDFQECDD